MRFTNVDGTALAVEQLATGYNDMMVRATSPVYGSSIDVLLDDIDQVELIVKMLALRTLPTIADADALAARLHDGQRYGDEPYIVHPRDVAGRVEVNGHHAIMAALLHDVVEDTVCTLSALRALGYPEPVVDAVDAVTRRDGETYKQFVRRAARHPLGRIIKLADNASNTAKLGGIADPQEREGLRRRYAMARAILYTGGTV